MNNIIISKGFLNYYKRQLNGLNTITINVKISLINSINNTLSESQIFHQIMEEEIMLSFIVSNFNIMYKNRKLFLENQDKYFDIECSLFMSETNQKEMIIGHLKQTGEEIISLTDTAT